MKSKLLVGAVLAMLSPAAFAAPIVWTSQYYEVDTSFGYLTSGGSIESSANILTTPLVGANNVTATAATITNEVSMRELVNANANTYEFKANAVITPDDAAHAVALYPAASMFNTFQATTSVLEVGFDFSSLIHFGASTSGASYQELTAGLRLIDVTNPFRIERKFSIANESFENNIGPLIAADDDHSFFNRGSTQFSLIENHFYELRVDLFPSIYTSNTSNVNSSNSVLNLQFSDGKIAASQSQKRTP